MSSALKVAGVAAVVGLVILVVLPSVLALLPDTEFLREAGVPDLAESLDSLREQAAETWAAFMRLFGAGG